MRRRGKRRPTRGAVRNSVGFAVLFFVLLIGSFVVGTYWASDRGLEAFLSDKTPAEMPGEPRVPPPMPDPDDGPRIVMDGGLETSVTTDKIKEKVITGDPVDAAVNVRAVYAVQVGAFKGGREAERMVNRLTKRGYPAYIVVADVPGQGRLHKVRIGRFDHRAEADRTARRVRKKEGLQTFVTIR